MRRNLILLLLAATIVIAACSNIEQETDSFDDSVEFRTVSDCQRIDDDATNKYNCYLEVAVETANVSVCDYIDELDDSFINNSVYCQSAVGHVK